MAFIDRVWHACVTIVAWLTMSPTSDYSNTHQHPLGRPVNNIKQADPDYPIFKPPPGERGDHEFVCEYPEMTGFVQCSIPENRECWLRHPDGREFNIHTNYEDFAPVGITRNYTLNITNDSFNADGQNFPQAKLFNGIYPGPWLEACWGDTLNITVINSMTNNGTSIHWHGIRQNQTMDMDGVNGITQCPIAPGDSFNYVFKTTQYGTSWYHSHYSVQYADGLQGPLTIHGPQSAPYDATKRPLIMTDWSHESAFRLLFPGSTFANKTILMNGAGNVSNFRFNDASPNYVPSLDIPETYELHFNKTPTDRPRRPKRYLLRLINTSFESTFVFSIDNHWLQIVTSDFVPIEPYFNTSVLIGIGQRYNVIVEANPLAGDVNPVPEDGNFWIRTWVTCVRAPGGVGYERTGILRYNHSDTALPTTQPWVNISLDCSDETYTSLRPKLPWYVGPAANGITTEAGEQFNVTFDRDAKNRPEFKTEYPLATFGLQRPGEPGFRPLQINYSDPVMMHLDESHDSYPPKWVVIPEDFTEDEWVYLVLTMYVASSITNAHPIHLHGHDFAILQQQGGQLYDPSKLNLKLDNPPRRDVVLLPAGGFVVIAFKADNPGIWLMHCHIARHASEGLALQVLERQPDANRLFPVGSPNMIEAERVCQKWKTWEHSQANFFDGDSGI